MTNLVSSLSQDDQPGTNVEGRRRHFQKESDYCQVEQLNIDSNTVYRM